MCCDWLLDVGGLRPVLSFISFLIAFFISSLGAVYHAPLLALAESGERKVYCLARCSRAVVDSGETATGSGKCTVLFSGKWRVPTHAFIHISQSPQLSQKHTENSHHPRSPTRMEGLHTMAWFPKGIVHDTAIDYPSAMQP